MTLRARLKYRASCLDPTGPDYPGATKQTEYVLYERNGSVAGLTIQHRVAHAHGPATYGTLKHFAVDVPPEIQEILVLGGVGSDHRDGARLITYTGNRHWLLNNTGEQLRVVAADGTVLDVAEVPAHTCVRLPAAPSLVRPALVAAAAFGPVR
jgi:hypothetical protein